MQQDEISQNDVIELAKEARLFYGDKLTEDYAYKVKRFARLVVAKEREACELIEYDLAKSPAMFATMAEYKSYRDGVEKYRAAIRARGEAS